MGAPPKYWAFISYSHADDAACDWLFKALETYRVPRRLVGKAGSGDPVPARLFPIFRDRDELGGSSELSGSLIQALATSRFLVVICSPRAARSRWVDEEVRQFRALGGDGRVLALIADGEPHAADPLEECFPPALRDSEPIAADIRPRRETRQHALLKLVAGIIGVALDELIQRERQRIRARRIRLALGAAAACIAASLGGAWLYVDDRIERHIENGRQAMLGRDFGRAAPWLVSALSMQSQLPLARERTYLAAMLGVTMAQVEQLEWVEVLGGTLNDPPSVNAARTRIAAALNDGRIVVASLLEANTARSYPVPQPNGTSLQFSEDERGVFYWADGAAHYLDLASGAAKRLLSCPSAALKASVTRFGRAILCEYPDRYEWIRIPDGRLAARVDKPVGGELGIWTFSDDKGELALATYKDDRGYSVAIVDLVRGGVRRSLRVDGEPRGISFDTARHRVAIASPRIVGVRGVLSLWDYETGRAAWSVPFPAAFRNIAFSRDGQHLVTTSLENRAVVWRTASGQVEQILDSDAQIRDAEFFPDGKRILTQSQDGSPRVWDIATGSLVAKLEGLDSIFARSLVMPDGKSFVALRNQGTAQFLRWRLDDPRLPHSLEEHASSVNAVVLSADENRLVSIDGRAEAIVWDVSDWRPMARFADVKYPLLSRDGSSLFAASEKSNKIRILDVGTGATRAALVHDFALKSVGSWSARDEVSALDENGQALVLAGDGLQMRKLTQFVRPELIEGSLDGSMLAIVADRKLEIVDALDGRKLASYPTRSGDAWGIEFSPGGERLIAVLQRESYVIDIASHRQTELVAAGASAILWSQLLCDGAYAVAALGNYRFQVHDARTGQRLRDYEGASGVLGRLSCDRDAGLIMASDLNGWVTVWRMGSVHPIAKFALAKGRLWSNLWIPGKRTAVIASEDGRIYLVPLPLESRSAETLQASLSCRVPYRVSGDVLVRDVAPASCRAAR